MKKIVIGLLVSIIVIGTFIVCSCPIVPKDTPDEYIKVVHSGITTQWADASVDSDDNTTFMEFMQYGTAGLSIVFGYSNKYFEANFPGTLPSVISNDNSADCTITEVTTDADYVTLTVEFDPAKDEYTLIECRAKKDW